METSLLKKGFWSNLILLSSLLIITLTFGYSKLPTNFKAAKSTLASISSDKADYQPGDTLRLSGTGFLPGETVTLHFDETPTVCPNGHNRSTVADSNGNIFYNQFYFNINHVGVAFVVTATGQSSGIIAQTTFTDANTALTSPSPTTAVYGSTITISSTLTQQGGNAGCSLCVGNGNPIPNRTLAFSVNGGTSLGSGVTNSSGAASSTAVIALNVGAYNGGNGLRVNFAGDSTPYAAQSATVNFSVTKATSSISAVSGSGIYGASATLTATVNLNIAGIPINFSLDGTSVGSANTNASGVATLVVPFASIPSSVRGANTWAGKVVAGIANTANYSATNAAGNLVISKLDVTGAFTASNKIYNGDNSATVFTRFLNGVLAGDTSNVSLSGGTASFADANVGAAKVVTLVGAGLTGSAAGNYNLTSVSTTTANIAARPITVTADAKSKIYGDSDPAFTYQLSETLIAGNAFSGSLSRIAGENVGSYDIIQGDLTLGSNYDLSFVGADLAIGQRAVEVTADAKSKTYGASDPAFTYQITQGSLAFSDVFSGNLSRVAGENVGSYDITQGDLTLGSNYDLSYVGDDLTIGQRSVAVTADAKSKTYGASDPAFTYQITQGSLAFSDAFSGSLSRVSGENVGSYNITQGDLTLGSNYDLSFVGADLAIGQRAVEVTADAKSKTYGASDPAFTYQITQGSLAFSDAFSGSLSRIAGENVGSYGIIQGDLTLGSNYDLSFVGADLAIGQRAVEVTADAKSKTYGASDPAFTYQITQGSLAFSDAFSGSLSRIAGENVGSYGIIQGDLTLGSNYDLSFVGADLTIGQRAVEVTADANSKTYGASDPAFTYQITQGSLAFSDAFSGSLSRVSGENVGSYDITQGDLTLGSNYDLSFVGADLTIGQRAVEVTADAKSKTYGDSDPNFTYQINQGSLAFSDAFSGSLSRIAGENVGSYDITQGDLTLGSNYDLSFVGADLAIGQRAVEVTADAKSKTYGASDPAFTYQITQGSLAFSDAFSGSLSRVSGENVGSYDITQGDLTLGSNYDLSYVGADLTIGQRAVEVTVDAKSKVFGDADPVLTYAITNGSLAFSDSFVGNLTRIAGEVIGSYAIQKGTLSLGGNYNLSYVGANLDIIGLPLTATVTKTDVTCNGLSNGSISITNPSGGLSGDYEYRLNSGVWQASGNFSNLSANTYSVQIRDAAHPGFIVELCTKVINAPALLSASCTNSNGVLYFGYTGDQTSTITVNPSGGVGPYTVSIVMNRPLMCNVITNSGDEIWTPGANTMTSSNTNVTCITSDAFGANQNPSSTSNNTIVTSLGYSLNVSLMADATFAITVTDQNGCTATCSTTIMAEDVRCFAGNSGVTKVMLCHKTGSAKNPCVNICVDNSAVAEHLAHGDFFGKCTSTCVPSGSNGKPEVVFDVKAYPNPSNNQFTFEIESESTESTDITVFDIAGRMVKQMRNRESDMITFGEELPRGVYLAVIEQGSNRKTVRIIKE